MKQHVLKFVESRKRSVIAWLMELAPNFFHCGSIVEISKIIFIQLSFIKDISFLKALTARGLPSHDSSMKGKSCILVGLHSKNSRIVIAVNLHNFWNFSPLSMPSCMDSFIGKVLIHISPFQIEGLPCGAYLTQEGSRFRDVIYKRDKESTQHMVTRTWFQRCIY